MTSLALKKVDGKLWILTEDSDEDSLHPSEVKQLEDATDMRKLLSRSPCRRAETQWD